MGNNLVPCCISTPTMCNAKSTRVILPGGGTRKFRQAVKAAEIMLEHSGHFLINSRALIIGRRFSALPADADLEMGNVYVMFPLRRVNSVVTAADVEVLLETATSKSAGKRIPAGIVVRVSPENGVGRSTAAVPSLSDFVELQEMKYRLSSSRSKKPLLETILEES